MATPSSVPLGSTASTASTPEQWVLSVGAAILVKLSASVDDVAWLLPFVAGARRATNLWRALQYILTMVCVAGTSCAIAIGGASATVGR